MNIVWKRPDNTVAMTTLLVEVEDAEVWCDEAQARGDFPADWEAVAAPYLGTFPTEPIEQWRWVGGAITVVPA